MSKVYFTPKNKQVPLKPQNIFSVEHLNKHIQQLFDVELPHVWVSGEISNFIYHSSGHMYFTLKDSRAQVKAAMFKGSNTRLGFLPENGMQVLVQAKVSLYAPRGDYQLVVHQMKKDGEGDLQQQFEQLKQKLKKEGLFSAERKKKLPKFSYKVGVITSPTGAVIRDICHVLARRAPWVEVIVYPSKVQGENAASSLIDALNLAEKRQECEALIIARGGGSLEDLWAFNDEKLAYTIARSSVPIISAVGHETDFSISDFVADIRAPTPSSAAELIAIDKTELLKTFQQTQKTLETFILHQLEQLAQKTDYLQRCLISPVEQLRQKKQRIMELNIRMQKAMQQMLKENTQKVTFLQAGLQVQNPSQILSFYQKRVQEQRHKIQQLINTKINQSEKNITSLARTLHSVSPLETMQRGYSITLKDNKTLGSTAQLQCGDILVTKLAQGDFTSIVIKLKH